MSEVYTITAEQRALIEEVLREIDELLAMRQGFNQAYREWKDELLPRLQERLGDELAQKIDELGPRQAPVNRQHRVHIYRQRLHAQHRFLQELLDQSGAS